MSSFPAINDVVFDGTEPPVVMLHGWGSTLHSLVPLGELLHSQTGRTVRLLDLPGFGKSDAPPAEDGWDTVQYAERIVAYLDEYNISRAVLVGHSFGGRITLRLASRFAGRIEAIVLMSAAGLRPIRTLRQQLRVRMSRFLGTLMHLAPGALGDKLRAYRDKHLSSEDWRNAGAMRPTLVKAVTEDQSQDVAKIRVPALLLWGEHDQEVPLAMARRLNELIQGSKLTVLDNRDHFPYLPSPDMCAYHIAKFLRSMQPDQASREGQA